MRFSIGSDDIENGRGQKPNRITRQSMKLLLAVGVVIIFVIMNSTASFNAIARTAVNAV